MKSHFYQLLCYFGQDVFRGVKIDEAFIYCAGGLGKEIFDVSKRVNRKHNIWDEICFIDDFADSGSDFYGTKVYSFDAVRKEFDLKSTEVVIAIGEPFDRQKIYDKLIIHNVKLATVIDNSSIVADTASIGEGVLVAPFCSISSLAVVERNVAINTQSIVGHNVRIGEHAVVSSMVNIGGACRVGENSYIGMGALIKEGVIIGNDVIIGMGSVVYNDVPDAMIALGDPARLMKKMKKSKFLKN